MNDLLATGLAHHRDGRLAEAELCYRQILETQPDHAGALHFLGLLARRAGQFDVAIDLISRAIRQAPANATYHYNLGVVLRDSGRPRESAKCHVEAVRLDPYHVEAWVNLGVALTELKQPAQAVTALDRAIMLKPDHAAAYYNRGNARRDLHQLDLALIDYETALRLRPDFAEAHANSGITLADLDRWPEAVAHYEQAVALSPGAAAFHYNLGTALRATGDPERAIRSYDRCLALDPAYPHARMNRANALVDLDRIEEALPEFTRAAEDQPDDPDVFYNRAVTMERAYRFEEALADHDRALALRPDFPECAYNKGLVLLLLGRLEEAWPWHEWRFQTKHFPGRDRGFAQPRWTGDPLNGRTLLIHAEQGFGDIIQFSRYAAEVKDGRVVMEVPRALRRLMTGLPGVDELVTEGDPLPDFDLHCPMLSLPAAFATRPETIPPPSRLPIASENHSLPAAKRPRIGIAWSGNPAQANDRMRSMPLRAMLPLLKHASFVCSLQPFAHDTDRATLRATPEIVDLGAGLKDFTVTAAEILAIDLVISVDTAFAHLAATLGKPTWILLSSRPDWRWQLAREDSPWYPSARLFRQHTPGDWDAVIAHVCEALQDWLPRPIG